MDKMFGGNPRKPLRQNRVRSASTMERGDVILAEEAISH